MSYASNDVCKDTCTGKLMWEDDISLNTDLIPTYIQVTIVK